MASRPWDNVSFDVYGGEILGIAGISGCGQKELLEAIAGLQNVEPGSSVRYYPGETSDSKELIGMSPLAIRRAGVRLSFVPEDRLGMGLVGSMGMTGNMMLRSYRDGLPVFTNRKKPKKLAESIIEQLEVVTPGVNTPVRRLSGGKRAEGAGGARDCRRPQGAHDGLRRPGSRHQHLLYHL